MSSRAAGWGCLPPELQQEVLERVPKWSGDREQPWRRRDLSLVCKSFAAALRGLQHSLLLWDDAARLEDPAALRSLLAAVGKRPGITSLWALVCSEQHMAAIAALVQHLPNLRELDLEGRPDDDDPHIDLLPPGTVDSLPALQKLKLGNPASLHSSLGRLTALRHLSIEASYALPMRLPEAVSCLGALESVDVWSCSDDLDCPVEGLHHLAALPHVTALSVAHVQLHSLEWLQALSQLRQLHLHTCVEPPAEGEEPDPELDFDEQLATRRFPIAAFEAALQPLTQLTRLELLNCFLEQVPECIVSRTCLRHLDLYQNHIGRIPAELFSHLQRLTHLRLADNTFADLPANLGALPQLAELDLSYNSWLLGLPPGNYPALTDLRLAECLFLRPGPLLQLLHNLTSLVILNLDGTPLIHRRPQFLRLLAALPSLKHCWPPTSMHGDPRPNRALLAAARHQCPNVQFMTH